MSSSDIICCIATFALRFAPFQAGRVFWGDRRGVRGDRRGDVRLCRTIQEGVRKLEGWIC
jgi:hypothetical protein